jgi:hypothetical protein
MDMLGSPVLDVGGGEPAAGTFPTTEAKTAVAAPGGDR